MERRLRLSSNDSNTTDTIECWNCGHKYNDRLFICPDCQAREGDNSIYHDEDDNDIQADELPEPEEDFDDMDDNSDREDDRFDGNDD